VSPCSRWKGKLCLVLTWKIDEGRWGSAEDGKVICTWGAGGGNSRQRERTHPDLRVSPDLLLRGRALQRRLRRLHHLKAPH
jgi:hypothetical protein